MWRWLRRCAVVLAIFFALCFLASWLPTALSPTKASPEKQARDRLWVDSSPYFVDRQLCRWMSLCGLHHLKSDPAALPGPDAGPPPDEWRELRRRSPGPGPGPDPDATQRRRADKRTNTRERRRIVKDIPDYVTKYAPLVHLYSGEQFWPSDIAEHVRHMNVTLDHELLDRPLPLTLDSLAELNGHRGTVALHSLDDRRGRLGPRPRAHHLV
ncbi:hypothetical protein CDD83_4078 [Cordyceps sp. RAO-2017]|nr:hypothetical protein CDD83_4078 [Cordyceps sp. RAO-2017]